MLVDGTAEDLQSKVASDLEMQFEWNSPSKTDIINGMAFEPLTVAAAAAAAVTTATTTTAAAVTTTTAAAATTVIASTVAISAVTAAVTAAVVEVESGIHATVHANCPELTVKLESGEQMKGEKVVEIETEIDMGIAKNGESEVDREIGRLRTDIHAGYVVCLDITYLKHECGLNRNFPLIQCSPPVEVGKGEGDVELPLHLSAVETMSIVEVEEHTQGAVSEINHMDVVEEIDTNIQNEIRRQNTDQKGFGVIAAARVALAPMVEGRQLENRDEGGDSLQTNQENTFARTQSNTTYSSAYRGKSLQIPWDSKVFFASIGTSYRPGIGTDPGSDEAEAEAVKNTEELKAIKNVQDIIELNSKLSKKRKKDTEKEKERERAKQIIKKGKNSSTHTASPGPKKVLRHVAENVLPSITSLTQGDDCERSQYGMHMVLESYSFFDEVCQYYEAARRKKKLIGITYLIISSPININLSCCVPSCLILSYPVLSYHILSSHSVLSPCCVLSSPIISCPLTLFCHPVVSCPLLSYPVLPCPIILSCRVVSCRVVSCRVVSCRVLSCPVLSCTILSCPFLLCDILYCPVLSCCVASCPVLSYVISFVLLCLFLSCLIPSCPVLYYPVLS